MLTMLLAQLTTASACPSCGSGFTDFFVWGCNAQGEMAQILVGHDAYTNCQGEPTLVWGIRTDWYVKFRSPGNSMNPDNCSAQTEPPPMPTGLMCVGEI
ncbi:MAG: hypothetical protein ABMB14_29865, partial [Myxococcota bacterium]